MSREHSRILVNVPGTELIMPWTWWNSSTAQRAELSAELSEACTQLDRLARSRPELNSSATTLSRLIEAMASVPARRVLDADSLDQTALTSAWAGGIPWFWSTPPPIEEELDHVVERCLAVVSVLEQRREREQETSPAPTKQRLFMSMSSHRWLEGARAIVSGRPDQLAVVPEFAESVASVLRLALLPVLSAWSATTERLLPELAWERRVCPHCGSAALLAELRGLEQFRFLRCGLCAGSWKVNRLGCAVCGELDPHKLVRLPSRNNPSAHLHYCLSCGERLPLLTTLRPMHFSRLLIQELLASGEPALPEGLR